MITAPHSKISEIKKLVEILDTEKPEDVAVRVIALRNVDAEDLVREISPLYTRMSGRSLKDRIEVTSNSRSNSLIVLSNESNYNSMVALVRKLDTENAQKKVMKAFPLKNSDAEDGAQQLQDLYSNQSITTRYYYNYGRGGSDDSDKLGFVADRPRNTVIVQAPPGAIANVEDMIETLDEPITDDSLAPRIFPLKFVSAIDIEEVLNELFLKKQQQRDYFSYYYDDYGSGNNQDAGRLYGKVRITSEPYSNSIIVTSYSLENMVAVQEILDQLDVPSQAGETTLRLGLNSADAIAVANSINILFASSGSPPLRQQNQQGQQNQNQQQQNNPNRSEFVLEQEREELTYYPWLGAQQDGGRAGFSFGPRGNNQSAARPLSDLIGRVRVVPDPRTNAVIVTSNVHFLPQVLKLIRELDLPTAQVLIEAKIAAVSTDFRDRLGIRWSPDGSQTFDAEDMDNSVIASTDAFYRNVFSGSALPNSSKTGILESTISLDFLMQFLKKNTDANVMAEPQINVADNELGKLFVGSQVPFITDAQNTPQGVRNDAFAYKDVGITLEVTPHVNNEDEVSLKIRVESSSI